MKESRLGLTKDRLEAEILRARIEGYKEGRDGAWKLASLFAALLAAGLTAAKLMFF